VRRHCASQYAHQGALAGAILTDEPMNFTRQAIERDVPECLDSRERFVDVADSQDRKSPLCLSGGPRLHHDLNNAFSSSSLRSVSTNTPSGRSALRYFL